MRLPGLTFLVFLGLSSHALGHPGSGIAVDRDGNILFVDTGQGVWKLDRKNRLNPHRGPAHHWMALDPAGQLASRTDIPPIPSGTLTPLPGDPAIIVSSDVPIAIARDGSALFYPRPSPADQTRVQLMRFSSTGGPSEVCATLPPIVETRADGQSHTVPWVQGLTAAHDGSIYYAERQTVRRVSPDGTVTTIADKIEVADCARPPAAEPEHLGPALRDLTVMPDGTVYVAASACCALLRLSPPAFVPTVVLRSESPWSPTAVTHAGDDVYVLEYLSVKTERREEWLPRVRKLSRDGTVKTLVSVERPKGSR